MVWEILGAMGRSTPQSQGHNQAANAVSLLGLVSLVFAPGLAEAATRPIRGGASAPPTVVNPDPPPRPSQMVAGRNAGNMVLATPTKVASPVVSTPLQAVKVSTDP